MVVNSENIEFGYELISVIPYAYYHRDKLKGTVSGNDTESLYYFSPDHKINPEERKFGNISKVKCPNTRIHKPYLDLKEFEIPPYKEIYANDEFKYDKETVIICNRANIEWSYKMINYFDRLTLIELFTLLQDKYQVIYINVDGRKELYDGVEPCDIGDFELLKDFPKVINFHDLVKDSWNETQLKVFANCEKFITMNGGHAILSAYFGGENIIMSKYDKIHARELDKGVNSFYRFYHLFNKQRTVLVNNERDLIKRVTLQWIDNEPIVNILVRTSKRPKYFDTCIKSIEKQSYKNINVFISDDGYAKYTIPHKVYPIKVERQKVDIISKKDYGIPFPANLYFNEMHKYIKSGLVMYLDDDDEFSNGNALNNIVDEYKKGNDLILWRPEIGRQYVPHFNFGKEPVAKDISGIGVAFDSKYLMDWEPYKLGDYRLIKELYKIKNKIWIDKRFTKTQSKQAGIGMRIDKLNDMESYKIKFINADKGSKYKNGDIVELKSHVAKQFVMFGKAEFIEDYKSKKKAVKKKPGRPKKTA